MVCAWLQRAAGHGHVEAQTLLAGLCVHGLAGDVSGDRPERLFAEEEPGEPDFAAIGAPRERSEIAITSEGRVKVVIGTGAFSIAM